MTERRASRLIGTLTLLAILAAGFPTGQLFAQETEQTVRITAQRFFYTPNNIILSKGMSYVLEFTSADVLHGFNCPDLGIRTDIEPGKVATIRFTPATTGVFPCHCDDFCGSGHEGMTATITVK
ncbi:MAG TPA: cupredoxin domain-containing protein [Syntrophorhabdaceae bacterium]|nr:cupredoxin domain-containing protein [Syntrophorhabdaceae bacterium]